MLNILMHVGGMPFNGDTIPSGQSLGGSESAAYYLAKELVARGHRVDLFCNMTEGMKEGEWDGVNYSSVGMINEQYRLGHKFHFISQIPYDVCIIQRHPQAFIQRPDSKLNIWWLHDLGLKRYLQMINSHLPAIDSIFTVSEWHKKQISEVYGISEKNIYATSNAFDYSQLEGLPMLNYQERLKKHGGKPSFLYAARPERGLINLVGPGGIMERLPDCKLYVCGYDNTVPQMRDFYNYLYSRCEVLPNVENVGALGKNKLLDLLGSVLYYVYPTEFEETFCTMILEANAVGTPFIGTTTGALPSVMDNTGGHLFSKDKDDKVKPEYFAKKLKNLISEGEHSWNKMNKEALKRNLSWGKVAENWEKFFYDSFERKTNNQENLAKHFEQHSDIVALKKSGLEKHLSDYKTNYDFFETGKYKEHYKAYYQYEADRGVVYGPEDLTGNKRFESTWKIIQGKDPSSILDYGCAHGHYIMNVAARAKGEGSKDLRFTGVDIEQTNIDIAIKWAEKEKETRAEFICSDIDNFVSHETYDMIIIGEVLEHVPEPAMLLEKLKAFAHDKTVFVISVPFGPWESLGYKEHRRAHIHHFERKDLEDMFSEQEDYLIRGIPHMPGYGHWLITFTSSDINFGQIDYDRKLKIQAPRESLSACLIVKDAEHTLKKCLDSIKDIVDEIIIGIDNTSSDEFRIFLTEHYFDDLKIRAVEIDSPLEIGFDEARNKTIEQATKDWILWLDADEEFIHPERSLDYLRNNSIDGYGISQHHFTSEPAGLMKTDFPVRIFRNNIGIKFYGHVHEHPEKKLNEGVGKVYLVPGEMLCICHNGYMTEDVRRKRFERNFPLMVKDREKNPDRNLGFFLWLRDMAHHCRYRIEKSGGAVTEDVRKDAEQAIELWRRLITENKNVRFVTEGLSFYSECVRYLVGDGGFVYDVHMVLENPKLQSRSSFSEKLQGYFINLEDIDLLNGFLYKELTAIYQEKYL